VDSDFSRAVTQAVRQMADEPTVDATLDRAVQMCTETIEACDMAGISVIENGRSRTLAASNEILRQVDQWQFELGEGPCHDALAMHETVTANDLEHDSRWPTYGRRIAEETGIHSSLSYRLFTTGDAFGALNLYALRPGAFGHEELVEGEALAAHAGAALANTLKEHQLQQAISSRTVIGQATGILMERFALDGDAAFGVLRRISQNQNLKLFAVAESLVHSGRLPGQDVPPGTAGGGGAGR
jgi:GAF domain-containing protein